MSPLPSSLAVKRERDTMHANTHLEFVHNGNDFILQSLIRYLTATQIDFIANQNNGDLDMAMKPREQNWKHVFLTFTPSCRK